MTGDNRRSSQDKESVEPILGTVQFCSRCHRKRKVNAHWQDTGVVLCKSCSRRPGVAYAASLRNSEVWRTWSLHA